MMGKFPENIKHIKCFNNTSFSGNLPMQGNPTCLWHICSQAEKSGGGQLHIDLPFSKIGGICPAHLSKIDALRFDATCYLKTDDCSFL
jgi:hypothetical protein